MKEGKILTLALSETRRGHYHIIGYLKTMQKFVSFDMRKYKNNNKYLLDIGAISKIYYEELGSENEIRIIGDIVLERYLEKSEFVEFLLEHRMNFSSFKRNFNIKYSIVEVKHIEQITVRDNKGIDTYMTVIIDGNKETIKIKDYRWIKYWEYILSLNDKEKLEERLNYYNNFFNERKCYLLLYRYKSEVREENRFRQSRQVYWGSSIFHD